MIHSATIQYIYRRMCYAFYFFSGSFSSNSGITSNRSPTSP